MGTKLLSCMLPDRVFRTFFLLLVLVLPFGCDDDSDDNAVKNCRIKEIYFDAPGNYTYTFHYNGDGTLNSITSPNVSMSYSYENGKLKTIVQDIGGNLGTLTYEYPTDKLITWTSSSLDYRIYKLYHTGDKADSMIVNDDAQNGQPALEFHSYPEYVGNNVKTVNSNGGCCVSYIEDVEYDNGLNPVSLMRKSVGAFTGQDIMNYEFFSFRPDQLSENNPTRYTMSGSYNALVEFEYTYATQGSYPLTLSQYYDGTLSGFKFNFVYENCD